jgi:hypothetical protein
MLLLGEISPLNQDKRGRERGGGRRRERERGGERRRESEVRGMLGQERWEIGLNVSPIETKSHSKASSDPFLVSFSTRS